MLPLQQSDWQIFYDGGKSLCLAMHINEGFLHWTRVELTNPLENFARGDDLERIVVNSVDRTLVT
jgi:hypothetical protein